MLLLTFSFFYNNARKSCTSFIEFLFPHDEFLQGKILPRSPLPSHPNQKIPVKTSIHFPIILTVCKHWSRFVTCSPPPPGTVGMQVIPKHIVIMFFDYVEQNGYLKILIHRLWEKNERGMRSRSPPIFWSLKMGTRTFNFR